MLKFQVLHRETIHPDVLFLHQPLDGCDVLQFSMLSFSEVVQGNASCYPPGFEILNAKTFHGAHIEV